MENKLAKLQLAKMFVDCLANGVDPVYNTDINIDTLYNEQVVSCFRFISDILARDIYKEQDLVKPSNERISEEQLSEMKVYSYSCKVSELASEINRVIEGTGIKKVAAACINDWLEAEGYVQRNNYNNRIATEKGKQLGITSEHRQRENGYEYDINFYNKQAQLFIYSHLNEIIAYRDKKKSADVLRVQTIDFPDDMSVSEFIRSQQDKCFIMAIGSCDTVVGVGSYIAVLHYNGKSKVLKKSGIATTSTNKCMLTGLIDAAAAIKASTDVVILSAVPLGFNSPKGRNYRSCKKLYDILSEKKCNVYTALCSGKGYEISSLVKSIR